MFDNIGTKIKNLAQVIYWITLIPSEFIAIAMIFGGLSAIDEAWYAALIGLILAIVSPYLCRISVYFIYGFGELIEKVTVIADRTNTTPTTNVTTITKNATRETIDVAPKKEETTRPEELIETTSVETVNFGTYNGNTEWIVLDKQENRALVISKYAIDTRPFNESNTSVTWETSSLGKWLNTNYLNEAFSSDEQSRIFDSKEGRVFLLSIEEAKKYFTTDAKRKATLADGTAVWWWLRSPGYNSNDAAGVRNDGSVIEHGSSVNFGGGAVRPALWIDISDL